MLRKLLIFALLALARGPTLGRQGPRQVEAAVFGQQERTLDLTVGAVELEPGAVLLDAQLQEREREHAEP